MIPVTRFSADKRLTRVPAGLALGRAILVGPGEAYELTDPRCVTVERRGGGPLGFFPALFPVREQLSVTAMVGDGTLLMPGEGAGATYRGAAMDLEDAEDQLEALDAQAELNALREQGHEKDPSLTSQWSKQLGVVMMIMASAFVIEAMTVGALVLGWIS